MTTHFQKTVDIKAVDEEQRTATGAVLVPNELDHQHDFLRPDAVERFHSDDVETGVMHSAFPEDAARLERSEVLTASETIGDETFPPGTWVATRKYEDDDLWKLVSDGVLQGFSIGGEIERAADHDELPSDIRVPDSVDHDAGGTELLDGSVSEVSDVDIPAVPRATYKGEELGKSLLDEVDGEGEFVELLVEERGHEEADARRLYQYLTTVREKSGDSKPGDTFRECVEIIMEEQGVSEQDAREICGALEEDEEDDKMSDSTSTTDEPDDATKWQILKSIFVGSGSDDASGAEAQGSAKADENEDMPDEDEDESEDDEDKHASGGDTPADTMSEDDTTKSDEPPAWAESLTEKVEQIDKRVTEIEADGDEKAMADAPAWAQDLAEKVDDLDERVDTISKQSGHSQQLDAAEKAGEESDDEVERFKSQLVGGRTGGESA